MPAAVVFLTAVVIGLVMGGLMFLRDRSVPAAIATGLGCCGLSIPVLHQLIGWPVVGPMSTLFWAYRLLRKSDDVDSWA